MELGNFGRKKIYANILSWRLQWEEDEASLMKDSESEICRETRVLQFEFKLALETTSYRVICANGVVRRMRRRESSNDWFRMENRK